jgi:FtsP/CotA-like multicopper oxidase with cupredoxin domain
MSAVPSMRETRRQFLRRTLSGVALVTARASVPAWLSACRSPSDADSIDSTERFPLRFPDEVAPTGLTLTAAPGTADFGGGAAGPSWLLNGSLPAPLLRARRGAAFSVSLQNQLPQDCILHWHGLTPPEPMDGHPRFAVGPGGSYDYAYTVEARAGTYWYHPHTHMRTAEQTYRGMAGLYLVEDDEEDALGLPSGGREIPLVVQDRRVDAQGVPYYQPAGPDLMAGYMGTEAFVNGVRRPYLEVDTALYRFRILNGSNARILRIGREDQDPLVLIGNDGGLMDRPRALTAVDVAPAERIDFLLDLRTHAVGDRVMLRSLPFSIPLGMGFMGGSNLQGQPLDLLELRVTRAVQDGATIPETLPPVPAPDPSLSVRERTFVFRSEMMLHTINGSSFAMTRVDETVPFGDTEIWSFVNQSFLPHPVHLHATHFKVLSRSGGRGQVMPWEEGVKDTVLILPQETVRVAVRFTAERGLFLLHCHNLEHEDMGMMLNILVE